MARNEKVTDELIKLDEEIAKKRKLHSSVIDLIIVEEWLNRIKKANK